MHTRIIITMVVSFMFSYELSCSVEKETQINSSAVKLQKKSSLVSDEFSTLTFERIRSHLNFVVPHC